MSSRNNRDRLKRPESDDSTAAAVQASGGTLNFVVPTEFVDLPSGGKFYTEGHPLHKKDSIEIKLMTAKEEDILTNKSLLKKGIALDRMLQNIIIDPQVKLNDLLIGDKNALIVASRISAYGSEYDTKVTCPACFNSVAQEFDLSEFFEDVEDEDASEYGAAENEDGTFTITLPVTQAEVTVRLLTGSDENKLNKTNDKRKKKDAIETMLTDHLKQIVVSINGVDNRSEIGLFIENLPANDSRFLRVIYAKLTPNLNNTQDFECPSCGYEQDLEVPFTTDFFWPKL